MSTSVLKSSCCTSRTPPSPDAVPSRPAIPAVKPKNRVSKDHVPSWISADTKELRAMFEEADVTDPCSAKHISRKDSAKFREILEGDKFITDSDFEGVKTKKSSSTLQAVTQKLKRHLSKDEGLSKRHSRNSVGTSEEEIERRAELRRIRERRIREELSNEGIYDDDAKSVPSPPDTPLKNDRKSSWIPGNYVPLPVLFPVSLPLPELDPLEKAHELLLDTESPFKKSPRCQSNTLTPSTTKVNSTASISRRHSSPALSIWDLEHDPGEEGLVYIPSRKRSSIPEIPAAPMIRAQRLPSLTDPAISAWRLSFSVDKRGQHLRKLSQGYAVPVTLDTELLREASPPVERWLHGPGMRSPSPSTSYGKGKDVTAQNCSVQHVGDCTKQDFGGVDGAKEASSPIHLQEMEISRRLASGGLQSSASTPQLSSWGSHQRGVSSISNFSQAAIDERDRNSGCISDSARLSDHIPHSWGAVVEHPSSSVYPSSGNSMQPSRESSLLNILSLFPGPKGRRSQATTEATASESLCNLAKSPSADLSSASLAAPLRRCPRPSPDDSSLVASETESFRLREVELSNVETRFASSDLVRGRNTPVSSKFKEEFDVESERPGIQPRKPSVFNRLAKLAVKSYDGSSRVEKLLDVPMPSFDAEKLRTPNTPGRNASFSSTKVVSPLAKLDDTAHIWGIAIKKNGRAEQVADKLHIPGREKTEVRNKSAVEDEIPKSAFETLIGFRKGKKKKSDAHETKSSAEEYIERLQQRLAVKELVMDSWEDEMAATAAKAKAKSRSIVKKAKPTMPDRRYPSTWARFNSEDREKRCISAGAPDHIDIKDFAAIGRKDDGEILWCLEHDDDGHHTEIAGHEKGIRDKIGDRIKQRAYEFDTGDDQFLQTGGRRGSLTVAGELEYPELEVLPITLRTTEEIEAEIRAELEAKALKEKKEAEAKKPNFPKLLFRRWANDGSHEVDGQGASDCESEVSIADPRFYDDCVIYPVEMTPWEPSLVRSQTVRVTGTQKKNKYRTWHGKDREGYLATIGSADVNRRGRNATMGNMVMRKSTDDYFTEVEKMERLEKERVLSVVEGAWGDEQRLLD
ncbi:uncharacterized protein RAG0_07345 [Rhynchosporium agropyri]|uniref:Uncharacterized protein n=1 Tax=Rhynchosporium agropyri TaxID=914238 RepID=A0A1E1KL28_9HELO|nr:uncharacterized protein RAG0_07345 [Rhynchosporium agropyri]